MSGLNKIVLRMCINNIYLYFTKSFFYRGTACHRADDISVAWSPMTPPVFGTMFCPIKCQKRLCVNNSSSGGGGGGSSSSS